MLPWLAGRDKELIEIDGTCMPAELMVTSCVREALSAQSKSRRRRSL
jgi:hypothetical protein